MLRQGISPILASVIIIAVTIVIAIGVIGWVMGLWSGFGSTESLQIYPDSWLRYNPSKHKVRVFLHVKNTGTIPIVITKVEIAGKGECVKSDKEWTLPPGAEAYLKNNGQLGDPSGVTSSTSGLGLLLFDGCDIDVSTNYQIKVYTDSGNVYMGVLRLESIIGQQ